MNLPSLIATARAMAVKRKGLLDMDESVNTCISGVIAMDDMRLPKTASISTNAHAFARCKDMAPMRARTGRQTPMPSN